MEGPAGDGNLRHARARACAFSLKSSGKGHGFSIRVGHLEGSALLIGCPMREWILMLSPIAVLLYFFVYPDQLRLVSDLVGTFIR